VVLASSQAVVEFEAVRVPFIVTSFKEPEAFPDRFVYHRLPYRRAALEPDHALVDALFSVFQLNREPVDDLFCSLLLTASDEEGDNDGNANSHNVIQYDMGGS
jgi:hypothetical protein